MFEGSKQFWNFGRNLKERESKESWNGVERRLKETCKKVER